MTRSEREQLIERYLREELTPSEEQDFFIEAATDKELRFDLKASRVVESAFRKDREAAPTAYSPMREHFAQLLAAGHAEGSAAAQNKEAAGQAQSGKRKPTGWIVTAASIGLLSLLSFLLGIVAINKAGEKQAPIVIEGSGKSVEGTPFTMPQRPVPEISATPVEERTGSAPQNRASTPEIVLQNRAGQSTRTTLVEAAEDRKNRGRNENGQQENGARPPSNSGSLKPMPERMTDTTDPDYNSLLKLQLPPP